MPTGIGGRLETFGRRSPIAGNCLLTSPDRTPTMGHVPLGTPAPTEGSTIVDIFVIHYQTTDGLWHLMYVSAEGHTEAEDILLRTIGRSRVVRLWSE